ncbi:hypothetical protein KTH_59570 [Thermosporothrix hazakensis]|nr:hypothetical protein KTH_59570 [Thermosporothrix hazakensis]
MLGDISFLSIVQYSIFFLAHMYKIPYTLQRSYPLEWNTEQPNMQEENERDSFSDSVNIIDTGAVSEAFQPAWKITPGNAGRTAREARSA